MILSKYSSKDCVFLVDGYNLLGVTTQVTDSVEAMTEDTTALGDTWEEHAYLGIKRGSFSQQGFFDDAADSVNAALNEQQGVSRIICYGVEGNTSGQSFTGLQGAMQMKYERLASVGKLHRANAEYHGNGIVEDGKILHALAARTADGDTEASSVDGAAATADGGSAYLHVTALTLGGYTNLTVTVRQSADNAVWEDLTVFTAVAAAPSKERKAIVGNIKRYLAVSYAFTGAGADPSATFFAGLVRD